MVGRSDEEVAMVNDEEENECKGSHGLCEWQLSANASNGFGLFCGGSWESSVIVLVNKSIALQMCSNYSFSVSFGLEPDVVA